MTYGFDTPIDFIPLEERGRLSRSPLFSHTIPGAAILALAALFGYWTLYVRPAPAPKFAEASRSFPGLRAARDAYGALTDPRSSQQALLSQNFALEANLDLNSSLETALPATPDNAAPADEAAQASGEAPESEGAPLPVPRPADLGAPANPLHAPARRLALQNDRAATVPADNRSFFDKLFSMVQPSTPATPSKQVLAYASPEDGAVGSPGGLAPSAGPKFAPATPIHADGGTAIYDISAHTVYLPDGRRLEAHSGLGQLKDDPRYVSERMRGATPPSTYELSLREQLFHGVQALRLTPVSGGGVYGRAGLLAHRYMLGPNGNSNGCVSFRDYNAFLQAYQNGQVRRLVVVARMN